MADLPNLRDFFTRGKGVPTSRLGKRQLVLTLEC